MGDKLRLTIVLIIASIVFTSLVVSKLGTVAGGIVSVLALGGYAVWFIKQTRK